MPSGMRVGFFGSFYPFVDGLATTSTGLVYLLANSSRIQRLTLFTPKNSSVPEELRNGKIENIPCWSYNSVTSILTAFLNMVMERNSVDVFLFNIHLTSFGKSKIANGLGLLLPSMVAKITGLKVVVYMHNFVETEDVAKLGYGNRRFSIMIAKGLERLIAINTKLVVPLESQSEKLNAFLRTKPENLSIPYVEGIYSALHMIKKMDSLTRRSGTTYRVLLFGSWGPQKDLEGALMILGELITEGIDIEILVAGSINMNFPHYYDKIQKLAETLPKDKYRFMMNVPDESVHELFVDSDLLFLPYNAAGGYSAVMNIGALFGLRMMAYDLPQLREFSNAIETNCEFVDPNNRAEMKIKLKNIIIEKAATNSRPEQFIRDRLQKADNCVGKFLEILEYD
ncbi:MAG: glycosyltransferase [Nitrososphaerota archaeon]|nr:glycosyltransferase [Nitrososphaerota archaeon]